MANIGLGLMHVDSLSFEEMEELFLTAYDKGVRIFDTADIYGGGHSESRFGEVLARHSQLRSSIILQSKCGIRRGFYDFSYEHIMASVQDSLKRLQTGYLDRLLFHRPDVLLDFDGFVKAIKELKETGLVREFGVSNMDESFLRILKNKVDVPFVCNQLEFSLVHSSLIDPILFCNNNDPLAVDTTGRALPYCLENGIQIQAWGPLSITLEEGPFIDNPKYAELNGYLTEVSCKYGMSRQTIALAFIQTLPYGILPIVGIRSVPHLLDALAAETITLTKQEWYRLYVLAHHVLP